MQKTSCVSCQHEFIEGQNTLYCPNCGQRQRSSRFSVNTIIGESLAVLLNLERGLFPTVAKLFTAPGEVVRGYWEGKTRAFTNPIRYAFLMVTLSTLVTVGTGLYDKQFEQTQSGESALIKLQNPDGFTPEQEELNKEVQQLTKKYLSVFSLILIPIGSISLWVFFMDKKRYYGEHVIAACYYLGHTSLIGIPFSLLALTGLLTADANLILSSGVGIVYGIYMIRQTYQVTWLRSILSGPGVVVLSAFTTFLIITIVGVVFALLKS